uniref:Uncharacterized protein n=1 Tax=Rhizophora mucronata TaxID=61149 RepID=A0A2P2NAY9_RHIMU
MNPAFRNPYEVHEGLRFENIP